MGWETEKKQLLGFLRFFILFFISAIRVNAIFLWFLVGRDSRQAEILLILIGVVPIMN